MTQTSQPPGLPSQRARPWSTNSPRSEWATENPALVGFTGISSRPVELFMDQLFVTLYFEKNKQKNNAAKSIDRVLLQGQDK